MLRRYFRITAHEAEYVLPEWERELLLDGLRLESGSAGPGSGPGPVPDDDADPFAEPPPFMRERGR